MPNKSGLFAQGLVELIELLMRASLYNIGDAMICAKYITQVTSEAFQLTYQDPCGVSEFAFPPENVQWIEQGMSKEQYFSPRTHEIDSHKVCGLSVIVGKHENEGQIAEYKTNNNYSTSSCVFNHVSA